MNTFEANIICESIDQHAQRWTGWRFLRGETTASCETLMASAPVIQLDVSNAMADGRANYSVRSSDVPQESASPFLTSPYLLAVFVDVESNVEDEFNQWYDNEHIPRLIEVDGVDNAVRFQRAELNQTQSTLEDKRAAQYLAIYGVQDYSVIDTPAWVTAARTEWTLKLRPFFLQSERYLMQRVCE